MDTDKRKSRDERLKKGFFAVFLFLIIFPWFVVAFLHAGNERLTEELDSDRSLIDDYLLQIETLSENTQFAADPGKSEIGEVNGPRYNVEAMTEEEIAALSLSTEELYDGYRKVYLTFDDGPSANTEAILDILKQYDVKATFFVIMREGREFEDLYRRIVDEGHTLGMHSCTHVYSTLYKDEQSFKEDTERLRNFLYMVTGVESDYYRFPGGSSNKVSPVDMRIYAKILEDEGIEYYDWNMSSQDATSPILPKESIVRNVTSNIKYFSEPMILRRGRRKKIVRQAPEAVEYLAAQPCDLRVACGIEVTGETHGARVGDTVVLRVVEWPRRHTPLKAEIVRVLGNGLDIGVQMDALIETHGLPREFPEEALSEAAGLPDRVTAADVEGRFDARDIPLFTIDGDDAKDFDDAVSLEKTERGWRLGVHIADVSHYVEKGGPIDREALRRGTSVYLPGRTLPMLPEKLCNDLCSLMPDVDRLAMSLFLELENGRAVDCRLENSVIHSRARLTYGEVNKLFAGEENDVPEALRPILFNMDEQARLLRKHRQERGSIDFDLPEPELTLDESGYPVDVQARVRGEAERLIEDFMLAANEAVAEMAKSCHLPFLYRVHEKPDPDRLAALELFLANMNHPTRLGKEPHPRQLQALLAETADLPEAAVIKHQLLRSLKRAWPATWRSPWATTAWRRRTTATSPRPSGAIPT